MKSSRLIAALLLSAMLFTAAACSDDSGKSQQSGETTAAAETTEAVETEIPDNLPASDFEGYEFTIMTYQPKTYYMETETGDILDDAKYARQLAIQERFNVKFGVSEYKTYIELTPAFQNSVLAGDNACDIAVPHLIGCCPGFINGHFVGDWNMTDYIDFSKPWWNQQLNDTMLINDRLFYIAGYVTLPSPMCMFYNKAYGDDYSFEDMNTVIREGRWTIDKLMEMAKTVSKDVNGDSEYDEHDQYGITNNNDNQTLNFMYGFNHVSVNVVDGEPVPNVNNEKMISMVEKINKLRWEDNMTLSTTYETQKTFGMDAFNDGRAMLKGGAVGEAADLRDSEIDFSVIPYPKWDEEQEKYNTHVDGYNGAFCFPINAPDPNRTSIIVEAMAAETYKQVVPVYYDEALGAKYFRDEESIEVMDMLFDGIIYDFGYVFDSWKGTTWTLVKLVQANSNDVASYWAGIESKVTEHYNTLYESLLAYEDILE